VSDYETIALLRGDGSATAEQLFLKAIALLVGFERFTKVYLRHAIESVKTVVPERKWFEMPVVEGILENMSEAETVATVQKRLVNREAAAFEEFRKLFEQIVAH
jgi:hypothetical protein